MRRSVVLGLGLMAGGVAMVLIAAALARAPKQATGRVPAADAVSVNVRREVARGRRGAHGVAFPSAAKRNAPAVLWAIGDGADGSDPARRLARRVASAHPQRLLYLGDVYETGSAQEFKDGFTGTYGGLLPITVPTPGNHDWPAHAEGYDPYWRKITGRRTPHWFAFTIGGWRVISLNSEDPSSADQLTFLDRELAGQRGTCTIAMYHRPRENAGEHGDATDMQEIWSRLVGRVPVVLSGHDHDLQRLRPVQGTTQYVIGAGGHSHYAVNADDPRLAFSAADVEGALRVSLRPGQAKLSIVDVAGRTLDRSTATCRAAPR